jgi:hypothetical protein
VIRRPKCGARDNGPTLWVRFVYGNDGWDVINDYSMALETIIEPITEEAERRYAL